MTPVLGCVLPILCCSTAIQHPITLIEDGGGEDVIRWYRAAIA